MARKKIIAEVEEKAEAVIDDLAAALERAWAHFKREFAEEYESLRLCPLQHGLETMIDKLKG